MSNSWRQRLAGGRFLFLMLALIALLLLYPWVLARPFLGLLANLLVVGTGIGAVTGSRRNLMLLVGLGSFHLAAMAAWLHFGIAVVLLLSTMSLALFYLVTVLITLKHIVRARVVNADTICGVVSLYLLLGFLWAALYSMVLSVQPDALATSHRDGGSPDITYFSFVTLCTIGYGDYTPKAGLMRPLAILEGIAGLFYMAVLVARFVSLFGQGATQEDPPDPIQ